MEQKVYNIPTKDYYRDIINILDFTYPFSELRDRQKDVYAEFVKKHYQYISLGKEERSQLIFNTKSRKDIAKKLGVSDNVIYNILGELTKIGFLINKENYGESELNDKYIPPVIDILTFKISRSE